MLAKTNKLDSCQFTNIFNQGVKIHSSHLFAVYLANQIDTRAAVVVSKKYAKTAVVRNAKRRMAFSVMRDIWETVPSGTWIIVLFKKDAIVMPREAVAREMQSLMMQIRR